MNSIRGNCFGHVHCDMLICDFMAFHHSSSSSSEVGLTRIFRPQVMKAGRSQAPHLAMFPGEQDPKIYITRYDRYLALS